MAIEIANQTKHRVNRALIERSVETVLKFGKKKSDVSIVIVGDRVMKTLNHRYRGKNTVTDILSFSEEESESPEAGFIGELIIDLEQINRQAKKFGHTKTTELAFIVIHGMLHLLGYEDESEKGRLEMEKLGYKLLEKMKI